MGGLNFPRWIFSGYKICLSHTTLSVEEECKGKQPAMSSSFFMEKMCSLCFCLHSRALRPETAFISWLKLFRPEGIDMQKRWFSYRSSEEAFIQKALALFLIHFSVTKIMTPPVNGLCELLAPLVCIGSKDLWVTQSIDTGVDMQTSPLQIPTALMKVTDDLYWGGQVPLLQVEGKLLLEDFLSAHRFSQAWKREHF